MVWKQAFQKSGKFNSNETIKSDNINDLHFISLTSSLIIDSDIFCNVICVSIGREFFSILVVDGCSLSWYEEINCIGESAAFIDLFVNLSSAN